MTSKHQQKGSIVNRFLNSVEKIGNKLPDPSVLFFLMCVGLAIMTWVISLFNVSVKHPGTHQTIYIKNIISHDGFTMIMNDTIKNFSEFPALGLVLAVMIGIGVAEKTGYFDKLMISVVNRAPRFLILPTIILIGILGSTAGDAVGSMGTFIVIVFFAAQLLAYLKWSNLGIIAAVKGAKLLEHQNGIVLILGIIVLSAMVNMLIGSASAKWGILGPIFVPMLILIGFHPAFTQVIYRVGDSITNPITPMMPYLPLLLTYAQKYDKRMKLGALLSSLMPYSIALSIVWTVFVIIWFLLGIPVGPGGPIFVK
ncbi:aminobenzoyl-glutamate transporter [Staphylococcus aureus W31983]|uniref:AbgT family transporter n=1 Tax=Staphylococcus aureus TaxID=1280 RepID=UPI00044EDA21|nr:AbgT family transporter [Staphylococcus aureus]EWX03617.1 aminobenzoyl-glutamate transporter [Staphylococcus aureus W73592]EWY18519.1 aminobenzoyl-glutamate transporter [Staphylococcus aureus W73601]EYF52585.1 aminobenzoyl-glutamate transporter [Staphylococcus aureus W31983]EYM46700.1 aminobenzoyl-glutamate transporter [Staphylococcus aureus W75242]MBH4544277.1 AbgT family transporter [Staphylococcus aureus]